MNLFEITVKKTTLTLFAIFAVTALLAACSKPVPAEEPVRAVKIANKVRVVFFTVISNKFILLTDW